MAGTTSRHSLWVRVMGAAQAAAKNRMVANSIKSIANASRALRAGLINQSSALTGAAASLVAFGMAMRRVVSGYERYTLAQSRLRTALAANTTQGARNAAVFAGPLAEAVGRDFGYSLAEANEAMGTMIQTGIGVHASMRVFRSSMRLARIADMDTANATRFLVDTMNMFRREISQGDGTLQGFADRMSGQLAVAAYSTSTNIEDLQQAFRYAGTELSGLGYNSQQVMSALAGLSVVGLRSTTAGTRLRGAMMAMHRTTGPLTELLRRHNIASEEIGQAWYDAEGNLRPFYEGLDNMSNLIRRVSSQQDRNAIQMHLFGRRAFAAGQFVTGMSQAAARARRAFQEMGEEGSNVGVVLERMERERMQSFSMQMTQLREGLSDLAIGFGQILFGEMQQGEEGFGSYIRQVSEGVMLIGQLNSGSAVAAERWGNLTPEVRQAAEELRATFTDIAGGLRVLGRLLLWMGRFTREHPYVVAGIIGIRIAFGGIGPAASLAMRGVTALSGGLANLIARGGMLGGMGRLMQIGLGVGILAIGNEMIPAVRRWGMEMQGLNSTWEQVRGEIGATRAAGLDAIPIVGRLIATFYELYRAVRTLFQVRSEREARRGTTEREVTRATGIQRMRLREQQMRGQARYRDAEPGEVRAAAVRRERVESMMRTAALMYQQEIRGRALVNRYLRQTGMTGQQLADTTAEIVAIQERQGENLNQEAEGLVAANGPFGILGRDMPNATRDAIAQLGQLSEILANINASQPGAEGEGGEAVTTAEDAYVRRGGIMGVSSGDLVVSRRHLADAITARRGALAGPAAGMAPQGGMAGPQPSTIGGGGELAVTVPVVIDGREVARAVGRASIQQLERGGGNIAPGQRRSLRETGFRRSV